MNYHRVAGLTAAGLALTLVAGPHAALSASSSRTAAGDVEILVGDVPQPRYTHGGRWYVEARKGREYAIRLRNPYAVRVAVALSVDGLNTIDARETTAADARKWVLGPFETVTIRGWQTSQTDARRFEFTTEARSYGQALGKANNLGVISAVFFRERASFLRTGEARDHARRAAAPPESSPDARSEAPVDAPSAPAAEVPSAAPPAGLSARTGQDAAAGANSVRKAADEYAATGMGRRTDHRVEQVWLDLEDAPAQEVNIRYEFHPELVRLGILPRVPVVDPLQRRERARGFEPGFSPEPPHDR